MLNWAFGLPLGLLAFFFVQMPWREEDEDESKLKVLMDEGAVLDDRWKIFRHANALRIEIVHYVYIYMSDEHVFPQNNA